MSYDPIHDTYVANKEQSPRSEPQTEPQSSPPPIHNPLAPAVHLLPLSSLPPPVQLAPPIPETTASTFAAGQNKTGYAQINQQPIMFQSSFRANTLNQGLPLPETVVSTATTKSAVPHVLATATTNSLNTSANSGSSGALASVTANANLLHLNSSQAPTDDSDIDDEVDQARKKRKILASNKSKHLKKAEGEPFWRRDIQYDFLKYLFDDTKAVFTNTFKLSELAGANNSSKLTFSELYIRTLAESSKCSKVLKERFMKDNDMAQGVAKVCLLVNAGRMNTTINFVPEMKSTLRTYHSIPSLQIDAEGNPKQLQDTPRLKSILKAVVDDNEAKDLDEILNYPSNPKPNTNLIQIIFLLTNYPHKIPFFEGVGNNFMEFFLDTNLNPRNRAQRFLWLLYTYLETDFTEEQIRQNPFGETLPEKVLINENPEDPDGPFDVDPEYEIEYANRMQQSRAKYLLEEHNIQPAEAVANVEAPPAKKKPKKTKKQTPVEPIAPLVDNFIVHREKVENLQFPVNSLNDLFDKYYPDAEHTPNDELNFNAQQVATNISRSYVQEVRTASKASTASFNKKTSILGSWIYRYFKYKRSVGNKLLGMEWEDIRYDLINGIESYLYQQFGQSLFKITESNLHTLEDGLKEDLSYLPLHDFENANEKSTFILQLISFCNDWFVKTLTQQGINSQITISFDLDNEEVIYN